MKTFYMITVGECSGGILAASGLVELTDLRKQLLPKIPPPPVVVRGYEERFDEAEEYLRDGLPKDYKLVRSDFGAEQSEDGWLFVLKFPSKTMFIVDAEFANKQLGIVLAKPVQLWELHEKGRGSRLIGKNDVCETRVSGTSCKNTC